MAKKAADEEEEKILRIEEEVTSSCFIRNTHTHHFSIMFVYSKYVIPAKSDCNHSIMLISYKATNFLSPRKF